MKSITIITILLSIMGIAACSTTNRDQNVIGSWYGTLPCADCEGIKTALTLDTSGTYTLHLMYLGKSAEAFQETGSWSWEDDRTLALSTSDQPDQYWAVTDTALNKLTFDKSPITGALAGHYVLRREQQATTDRAATQNIPIDFRLFRQGIDFIGRGNEPFWSLDVNLNQYMRFTALNYPDTVTVPIPRPDTAQDQPVVRYRAVTEKHELIVTFLPDSCLDTMSDQRFSNTIHVSVKQTASDSFTYYQGCGRFVKDYRLNDIWILEELNGQSVTADDFAGEVPRIEFHANDLRILGNDGCNNFNGHYVQQGHRIQMDNLTTTLKACAQMEASDVFLSLLQQHTLRYQIENLRLSLLKNGQPILVFRKGD